MFVIHFNISIPILIEIVQPTLKIQIKNDRLFSPDIDDNQESLDFTDSKNKKCIQCFTVQENRLIQNKQARMDPQ